MRKIVELSFDTIQRIGLKACEAGILACYVVDSLIIKKWLVTAIIRLSEVAEYEIRLLKQTARSNSLWVLQERQQERR